MAHTSYATRRDGSTTCSRVQCCHHLPTTFGKLNQLQYSLHSSVDQVGRALRAVDPRLKAEWIQWAENGTCSKDVRREQHRLDYDASLIGETTGDTTGAGLARISRVATITRMEQDNAAASLGPPSAESRSLLQRRRRRLRAWCSEVCVCVRAE